MDRSIEKIRKRRPLFNTKTPLERVPREWLKEIEPFIRRDVYLPCWIWAGAHDKNGYPIKNVMLPYEKKKAVVTLRRWVAKLFWDLPEDWYVNMTCQKVNCLNPNHMAPTGYHPNHYIHKDTA